MKTNIDVMMLFKFDIKWVRLNFKAIASMELVLVSNSTYYVHMFVVCSWKLLKTAWWKF